jgi:hypothetical protein
MRNKTEMTEEAKKKIYAMYELYGSSADPEAACRTCGNLVTIKGNRTFYKCRCYGESASEATDWRCSWHACGLYNVPYIMQHTVFETISRPGRKKKETEIYGQLSLDI